MCERVVIYAASHTSGSAGKSGVGVVCECPSDRELSFEASYRIGHSSCNRAGHAAVMAAVRELVQRGRPAADLFINNKLVAGQLNGTLRSKKLADVVRAAKHSLLSLAGSTVAFDPGEPMARAIELARDGLNEHSRYFDADAAIADALAASDEMHQLIHEMQRLLAAEGTSAGERGALIHALRESIKRRKESEAGDG